MRINSHLRAPSPWSGFAASGASLSWVEGAGWQGFCRLQVTVSTSTSTRADGTIRTHPGKSFDGTILRSGGRCQPAGVERGCYPAEPTPRIAEVDDVPHLRSRSGRLVSWPKAREAFEKRGVGAGLLDAAFENLFNPPVNTQLDTGYWDDTVEPDPSFGINRARLADDQDDDDGLRYGYMWQAMADMASIGAGRVRQMETGDFIWSQLLGTEPIPRPDRIRDALAADGWAAFANAQDVLVWAWISGVQLTPTAFSWGPGAAMSGGPEEGPNHDGEKEVADPSNGGEQAMFGGNVVTFAQLNAAKPDYHAGTVVATVGGWDEWYWQKDEVGHSPGDGEAVYQKFAVHVYPNLALNAYMEECARRKALGLVMFGLALGEWLAEMERMFNDFGCALAEVVPVIELGNEMNNYWCASDPENDSSTAVAGGPEEFGWFCGLLASAIRTKWSPARFRMAEIAEWGNSREWAPRCDWIGRGISEGIVGWCDVWNVLPWVRAMESDWTSIYIGAVIITAHRWSRTTWQLDIVWPPAGSGWLLPRDLVHEAGFHWYHVSYPSNPGTLGPEDEEHNRTGYVGEARMIIDAAAFKAAVGAAAVLPCGVAADFTMGEIGFPSIDPDNSYENQFQGTSEALQASVLVRRMVMARALGASVCQWHTHIGKVTAARVPASRDDLPWGLFSSVGLRQDVVSSWQYIDRFLAAKNAERKASWYAYRRLVWLFKRVSSIDIVHSTEHLFALRLNSAAGFHLPERTSDGSVQLWKYAWLLWRDIQWEHDAPVRSGVAFRSTCERFSMVPDVHASPFANPDTNGYAPDEGPDWDVTGSCVTPADRQGLSFWLWRMDPERPYLPCLLTDSPHVELA